MSDAPMLLVDFLASPRAPEGSLSMTALDGYLTALHVGPGPIPFSEWMSGVWGDGPDFNNLSDAQSILGALILHYNAIGGELGKGRIWHRPYGWPTDDDEPASTETAAEWSFGFWKAMRLRPYDWRPMFADGNVPAALAPILCFIETDDGESLLDADPDELDDFVIDAPDMIPLAIPVIREYWRSHPVQPRAARPGRNDRCPCGSEKKYKRCCGAD